MLLQWVWKSLSVRLCQRGLIRDHWYDFTGIVPLQVINRSLQKADDWFKSLCQFCPYVVDIIRLVVQLATDRIDQQFQVPLQLLCPALSGLQLCIGVK